MKSAYRWICTGALCLASLGLQPRVFAAELTLPRDGWVSWQVAAVDGAPDLCCFGNSNNFRNVRRTACQLDGREQSWGNRDNETTDQVRVYARSAGGKLNRLRVLSATCPAEAATPIRDLGSVAQNDSVRWLVDLAKQKEEALIALAVSHGDVARDALAGIARNDSRSETRKEAVFWLAQVRGQEGADIASSVMFNDKDPDVREHAVFALSQLPDELAARALIAAAENRSLTRELRKKAVFWLSQSDSDAAQKYLEQVLTAKY